MSQKIGQHAATVCMITRFPCNDAAHSSILMNRNGKPIDARRDESCSMHSRQRMGVPGGVAVGLELPLLLLPPDVRRL